MRLASALRWWLPLTIVLAAMIAAAPALGQVVTVEELESSPERYDCIAAPQVCRPVSVEGELVGDYGRREDGTVWVQLNDDAYARRPLRDGGRLEGPNRGIGLHLAAELIDGLGVPGRYEHRGPLVRVQGEFRYHDPARGGETYIEVASLELLEAERRITEPSQLWAALVGMVLLVGAAMAVWMRRGKIPKIA